MKKIIFSRSGQIIFPLVMYYLVYHVLYNLVNAWLYLYDIESPLLCLGISSIITGIAVYFIYRELPVAKPKKQLEKTTFFYEILGLLAVVALGMILNVLFTKFGLTEDASFQAANDTLAAGKLWMRILFTGISIPILEEIVFRGCVCGQIRRWYSDWLAVVISAGLFGIMHANIVQSLYGCIMGVALGILYTKSNKLWPCFLAHGLTNIVVILVATFS